MSEEQIEAKLDRIIQMLMAALPKPCAADEELDGPHGDPTIKSKDPRDWTQESMVGKRMSECPPDYLDMLAERSEYFARKNDEAGEKDDKGNPKSKWDRLAAAKARGWARRIRGGWKPPKGGFDDDARDLGF